jgi:hypothetical protein
MTDINQDIEIVQVTPKKRGRPKKITDMKQYMKEYSKKKYNEDKEVATKKIEYQKNRYNNDQEYKIKTKENSKKHYNDNKEQITLNKKELHAKYILALNILKKLIENDEIPSKYKQEVTLICT